jgi:hypothetical protein
MKLFSQILSGLFVLITLICNNETNSISFADDKIVHPVTMKDIQIMETINEGKTVFKK